MCIFKTKSSQTYSLQNLHQIKTNITYQDYIMWQNSSNFTSYIKNQYKFWASYFDSPFKSSTLNINYEKANNVNNYGQVIYKKFNQQLYEKLKVLAKNNSTTTFVFILATFYIAIYLAVSDT